MICLLSSIISNPVLDKKFPPKPFSYQYGVRDGETRTNFKAKEAQDDEVMMIIYEIMTFSVENIGTYCGSKVCKRYSESQIGIQL